MLPSAFSISSNIAKWNDRANCWFQLDDRRDLYCVINLSFKTAMQAWNDSWMFNLLGYSTEKVSSNTKKSKRNEKFAIMKLKWIRVLFLPNLYQRSSWKQNFVSCHMLINFILSRLERLSLPAFQLFYKKTFFSSRQRFVRLNSLRGPLIDNFTNQN